MVLQRRQVVVLDGQLVAGLDQEVVVQPLVVEIVTDSRQVACITKLQLRQRRIRNEWMMFKTTRARLAVQLPLQQYNGHAHCNMVYSGWQRFKQGPKV